MMLDKGQENPQRAGLGSLVAAQQFQTYDTFKPAFELSLLISYLAWDLVS